MCINSDFLWLVFRDYPSSGYCNVRGNFRGFEIMGVSCGLIRLTVMQVKMVGLVGCFFLQAVGWGQPK